MKKRTMNVDDMENVSNVENGEEGDKKMKWNGKYAD